MGPSSLRVVYARLPEHTRIFPCKFLSSWYMKPGAENDVCLEIRNPHPPLFPFSLKIKSLHLQSSSQMTHHTVLSPSCFLLKQPKKSPLWMKKKDETWGIWCLRRREETGEGKVTEWEWRITRSRWEWGGNDANRDRKRERKKDEIWRNGFSFWKQKLFKFLNKFVENCFPK